MKLLMKKHKLISILSILAILITLSPASAFAAEPMSDITNHWAKDQIQSWVDNGNIKGYPGGTFKPDNNITRAEFMTIVNKAFGYTEKAEISYSDVAAGSWYADAVAVAKAAGYINGYPNGTMKPDAPITRQEAAVIVAKIDELTADEAAAKDFTDASDIPSWSKGSVGACVKAEILTGYPDDTFLAKNNIKRGESVVALSKALAYKNAPDEITATVYGINADGFRLGFSPAVEGLTQSAVTLTQVVESNVTGGAINSTDGAINATDSAINVTVASITTTDNGETYAVTADLEAGKTYAMVLTIDGYEFGDAMEFTVLTDQQAADEVNTAIEALPAVEELTLANAEAIINAADLLDTLTSEQAALVTDINKAKLEAAIDKIVELEAAAKL